MHSYGPVLNLSVFSATLSNVLDFSGDHGDARAARDALHGVVSDAQDARDALRCG